MLNKNACVLVDCLPKLSCGLLNMLKMMPQGVGAVSTIENSILRKWIWGIWGRGQESRILNLQAMQRAKLVFPL